MIHDREIAHLIKKEELRQVEEICLIASENYVSEEVRATQGSILTNKYAEGLPGKRYYGGCEIVDEIEELAIERARNLFSCEFANVQPHSGSQANAAVFAALAKPGDTIMGMSLATGGHLTHGSPVNFSGKLYNFVSYETNRYGSLEYSVIQQLAEECRPKVIVAGYSAYSRELDFERFREIADSVGAYLVVDMAHFAGFIAAGLMASPLEFAHVVTTTTHKTLRGPRGGLILSNAKDEKLYKKLNSSVFPGTQGGPLMHVIAAKAVALKEACSHDYRMYMFDVRANAKMSAEIFHQRGFNIVGGYNNVENHMFLVDFSDEDFTGADVEKWLGDVGIIVNKNMIRDDKRSAQETSGIRIGLAAVTTRGLSEYQIAEIMTTACDVIGARGKDTEKYKKHIREIAVNANTNAQ